MAQLYLKDTGLLIDEGRSAEVYQGAPGWNPAYFAIADTGQEFKPFKMGDGPTTGRVPEREVWFFVPQDNLFYQSTPAVHAIEAAAKTSFSAGRWSAIKDAIEDHCDMRALLDRLEIPTLRRKIKRAFDLKKITAQELKRLRDVMKHFKG